MIRKNCKGCGRFFYAKPCHINRAKFCSKRCHNLSMKNRISVSCFNCGKEVVKKISNAKKNKKNFCSLKCHYENMEKKIISKCNQCGKKFEHLPSHDRKYCSKKCYQKSEKMYPKTANIRRIIKNRNKTKKLHVTYIKRLITYNNDLGPNEVPQELIELKRLNLKRKRIIKNNNQTKR